MSADEQTPRRHGGATPKKPAKMTAARRRRADDQAPTSDAYTPTHVLIDRLPEVRQRRGLTGVQLAERCAKLGAPKIDRNVVQKIEARTRGVSLDEAVTLAYALDCSLIHLICPREDNQLVQITEKESVFTWELRAWLRGTDPLKDQDEQAFATEIPPSEWQHRRGRRFEAEQKAARVERQLRILRKKAEILASELAAAEGRGLIADITKMVANAPKIRRLEAQLNVVYNEIAELAVDLEDYEAEAAALAAFEATIPMEPMEPGEWDAIQSGRVSDGG